MTDFPDPRAVDEELDEALPLPILFCHRCSDGAHALHARLEAAFLQKGLRLLLDPFSSGDDVQVAMQRLAIHGVVFHATSGSVKSAACEKEMNTARRIGAMILTICEQVETPASHLDRISFKLDGLHLVPHSDEEVLITQAATRARTHWVLQWLSQAWRTTLEREAGVAWLLRRSPQILAENLGLIANLHKGEREDPLVAARLARVMHRSDMREVVLDHLIRWHRQVGHPASRSAIAEILGEWGLAGNVPP